MRVLVYNWSPYDSSSLLAGGLAVVCRETIDILLQRGAEVTFLYAGSDYSIVRRRPSVQRAANPVHPNVPSYSLHDSPGCAPGFFIADLPQSALALPSVDEAFAAFLKTRGPFDVIHFHCLEGMSARALAIAKATGAKVLFTLHNHLAFCAQANLWRREQRLCTDYRHGADCIDCLRSRGFARRTLLFLKRGNALLRAFRLTRRTSNDALARAIDLYVWLARFAADWAETFLRLLFPARRLSATRRAELARAFRMRREGTVAAINDSVDVVLCHSRYTAGFASAHGVNKDLLHYLPHAYAMSHPASKRKRALDPGERLPIVFLGRMLEEKGIFFLAEELLALPETLRKRLDLRLAGRLFPSGRIVRLMNELKATLGGFSHVANYRREQLPELLGDRALGIVPSLSPETLSLVTLEMLQHGVPALVADRGALPELVGDRAFRFNPEARGDFHAKLLAIDADRSLLERFWQSIPRLPSLPDYQNALLALFEKDSARGRIAKTASFSGAG